MKHILTKPKEISLHLRNQMTLKISPQISYSKINTLLNKINSPITTIPGIGNDIAATILEKLGTYQCLVALQSSLFMLVLTLLYRNLVNTIALIINEQE